ncbi:MAG: VWA domain-containing protein [Myxococcota bacterium]|nr:VWA domain-containing protein [Myxococcota bacterium]
MTFESPFPLLLLAAAGLPVYLHLRRRRVTIVRLPTVRLLASVVLQRRPRLRFQALALLTLRVAIVLAAVLSVARPGVFVHRPGGLRSGGALAVVLVIDDSLSMHHATSSGSSFERAQKLALEELGRLRPGDSVGVIFTASAAEPELSALSFDRERAERAIEAGNAGYARGDLRAAIERAAAALQSSPLPQREIVLITDLSQGDDLGRWPPLSPSSGIGLRILEAGAKQRDGNTAVVDVQVFPAADGSPEDMVLEAQVASFGKSAATGLEISLEVDGAEAARGRVDVPANGVVSKKFSHRFSGEGIHRGLVRIGEDALPQDDVRYFSAIVHNAIRVLVVDGDPRPGSHLDEVFYLERALSTQLPEEVSIRPVVLDAEAVSDAPLGSYDVIFLAGLEAPKASLAERLLSYVNEGGGVFVSAGGGAANMGLLASLLPGRVVSLRKAPEGRKPYRIASVVRDHPVFAPFGNGATGLEQAQISAHLLVRAETNGERSALLELGGGLPLLLERKLGKGRVLFLATTIDREWTDIPIRPGFLPLVQRSARYLAGRLDEPRLPQILVGEALNLEISAGMQRLVVRDPAGKDTAYAASDLRGKSSLAFPHTYAPGHYRVWAEIPSQGGLRELENHGFIVVTDPRESNLTQVIAATSSESKAKQASSSASIGGTLPIWPYLLVAAMLLLLCETWAAGHGLHRSHQKKQ